MALVVQGDAPGVPIPRYVHRTNDTNLPCQHQLSSGQQTNNTEYATLTEICLANQNKGGKGNKGANQRRIVTPRVGQTAYTHIRATMSPIQHATAPQQTTSKMNAIAPVAKIVTILHISWMLTVSLNLVRCCLRCPERKFCPTSTYNPRTQRAASAPSVRLILRVLSVATVDHATPIT